MSTNDEITNMADLKDRKLAWIYAGALVAAIVGGGVIGFAVRPPGMVGWILALAVAVAVGIAAGRTLLVVHRKLRPIRTGQTVTQTVQSGEQACPSCESMQTALIAEFVPDGRSHGYFICYNCDYKSAV